MLRIYKIVWTKLYLELKMKKHFVEIIEKGENSYKVNDVFMCRNKDFKDPYMIDVEISPCMCRNKDFKDPYMELEQISKVA